MTVDSDDVGAAAAAQRKQAAHDYLAWYGWKPMLVHSTRWNGDGRAICSCEKGPSCPSSGKHPMLARWTSHMAESGADVEALWDEHPGANVGIVTGRASNLWVLDVDTGKGGKEAYQRLWTPPVGRFRVVGPQRTHRTGSGGFHVLYQLPPGVSVKSRPLKGFKGIDVRGEGGMVVAPPSVSARGPYVNTWHDPNNRATHAPDWLLEMVADDAADRGEKDGAQPAHGAADGSAAWPMDVDTGLLPRRLTDALGEVAELGERSDQFYRLVCLCREAGLSEGQAVTLLGEWCAATQPPLYPGRVPQEVRRAWGKHREGLTVALPPGMTYGSAGSAVQEISLVTGEVVAHPAAATDELFPQVDLEGVWETIDDEPEWLWEPFLEKGGSLAIYARPGAGKSLFSLEGAACLAAGWVPPGATVARRPLVVGYVDRENPVKTVVKRLRSMGFKPADLTNLHYFQFPTVPPLDTAYGGALFVEHMLHVGCDIVILDTTSKFIEGDEDKASTINALDRHSIQPLTNKGVGVLRVDHSGKDATRGQRGSSAKEAIGDAAYFLTAEGDVITLKATKRRAEENPEEIVFMRRREPTRHTPIDRAEQVREAAEVRAELRDEHVEELVELMLENGIRNRWKGKRQAERDLRAVLAEQRPGMRFGHDSFAQAYVKLASRQELSNEDE